MILSMEIKYNNNWESNAHARGEYLWSVECFYET